MSDPASFSIYNSRQIILNLSLLIKNKCLISVHFGPGNAFFLTVILGIDPVNKAIFFDWGPKEVLNKQLLKATEVVFRADFSGIKASFKGIGLKEIIYNGESAFTMPIPESLFWRQRREFFRVASPQSKASFCLLTLKTQESVKLSLHDISFRGFSVLNSSTEISDLLAPGTQFEQCKLVLSDAGEDFISFKICSKRITNPDKIDSLKIQKIGCVFTRITPVFQAIVQRYVNQLQRENIQQLRRQE